MRLTALLFDALWRAPHQLANMLPKKSMSLKLENIIVLTINLFAILRHDESLTRRA
jgi:hypothetical protein